MKLFKYYFLVSFLALFFIVLPAFAFPEDNLSSRLSGRILLDVENKGEAWYVYPGDFHRYYLGSADDAYALMKNLSLGISNDNFSKIGTSTKDRFKGLILLKVEDSGRAYYVNPVDGSLNYMASSSDAFRLMSSTSLGITNRDLKTIPIGKITGESGREWQYLGWWGRVNTDYVPARLESRNDSKRLGTFFSDNVIKVLAIKKVGGTIWYQIDGGKYPGAYVNSLFVTAIAQPAVMGEVSTPTKVRAGDYWIDVSISKKILTVYRNNQAVFATYIATGDLETPTISGIYNVWLKIKKIRMTGAPPIATHVYDLPNVPWVLFYKGSYSIHGTYWHDNFGSARSAGCTNITQGDSKFIFDLVDPIIGDKDSVYSSPSNPGVLVNNHY